MAHRLPRAADVGPLVELPRRLAPLAVVLLLAGCASATRSGQLGPLSGDAHLVTLVVTEDPTVIRGECPQAILVGNVLGCQTARHVRLPEGGAARLVKIVRFTDRVPSAMAFEIDLHELCHVVATLQSIPDPCHVGNGGVVQHYPAALPKGLLLR